MSPCSLRWFLLGAALFILSVPGCGGCRQSESNSEQKESNEPEAVVIISEPKPLPFGNEVNRMLVKPGHVVEAQQEFKVGPVDINGRIEGQTFSKAGQPLPVPGSRWSLNFTRDASLPNRQSKQIDLRFFVSPSLERDENSTIQINPDLRTVLIDRSSGTPLVSPRPTPTTPIPGHQYFFVVLSDHKDDYEYLGKSDLVSWPSLEVWDGELQAAYQLVLCSKSGDRWMLPSTFFGWTTTSFLLWDDVDPDSLTSSQKQALVDWLHWGGQLIISGPSSMSRLSGSFLEPYLPLQSNNTTPFVQAKLDFLNSNWALPEPVHSRLTPRAQLLPEDEPAATPATDGFGQNLGSDTPLDVEGRLFPLIPKMDDKRDVLGPIPQRTIAMTAGSLTPGSAWVANTSELVAERNVGRGRVVLSTISISDPFFARWRSFPSFVNAAMLGRPPRGWQENSFNSRQTWLYTPDQEADSRLATHFRIVTRDGLASPIDDKILFEPVPQKADGELAWNIIEKAGSVTSGWDGDPINGIAAWNSSSSTSNAAKAILRDAAGINVPKIGSVMLLLLAYLGCLVPLNWFVFYLLGKIEWAWAAVPFLAIGGVVTVAYTAQLDIGFARSYTEIAVVEAFENHSRAHVTRYSAIYSSLSTPYKLTLDSDSGVTVPMISREREFSSSLVETVRFDYGSADGNFLYPLNILSNSTTFLHTEQMIDLGGSLQFAFVDDSQSKFTLDNKSKYSWTSVAAFRRNSNGLLEAAWINTLPADSSTRAEFSSADMTQVANHWKWRESDRQRPTLQTDESPEKFSALMRAISGLAFMRAGEIRVIAFANGTVNGLQVEPATGSSLKYSALVLHVQCGKYPTPEPDRSLPSRQMSAEAQKRELEGSAGDDEVISAPETEDNSNEPKQP
jgi:hypothetical protein